MPSEIAGPLLMIGAMACFVLLDAILKYLVARHSGLYLSWVRCLVQVLLVAAFVPVFTGAPALKTAHPWLQVARGCCLALTSVLMSVASRWMPLSDIYVIAFAAPLIAAMIAIPILQERPTRLQWLLIAAGFAGVLIALNPTAPMAGLILLMPLMQAAGNALYHVLTRLCARTDRPPAQLFHSALAATAVLTVTLPWTYTSMTAFEWALLSAGGALVTFGHYLLVTAFAMAPTARVSPMVYTQLLWATLIGYLVFGDVPGAATVLGGAVIITSGILLIRSRG